jgi:polyisoprenyl-teichoic acid--peptidoglycan teichoic acid transferase
MRIPGWLMVVGLVVVFLATGLLSVASFTVTRQLAIDAQDLGIDLSGSTNFESIPSPTPAVVAIAATATPPANGETPVVAPENTPLPTATVDPVAAYQITDPRRITILLLGIDQRSVDDNQGPYRTDTMILVSVDPVRRTAGVLSIPRDLWVNIPGFRQNRINTANMLGDNAGLPGGGPALAAETVSQTFGIPVDNFILVNFEVFTTLVSTIAPQGVEVCVREPINDTSYPDAGFGTITVTFDPGCQTLVAERLLQYARTRHGNSDFERAQRQQDVLQALREQLVSVGGITGFLGQAPALWEQLLPNVQTNLTLQEILQLGNLATQIDEVNYGIVDNLYTNFAKTPAGEDVLVLNFNAVSFLLQQVFGSDDDLDLATLRSRAEAENASIDIFNNAGVPGLAQQTANWLDQQGVSYNALGNVPEPTDAQTTIRVYTGRLWTAKYLAALLGIPSERVEAARDELTQADIAIVVGSDMQAVLAAP